MPRRWLPWLFGLFASVTGASWVAAEYTVQALTIDTPLIVRGVVVRTDDIPPLNNWRSETVTVRVTEMLKGDQVSEVTFVHDYYPLADERDGLKWLRSGHEYLWFLRPPPDSDRAKLLRLHPPCQWQERSHFDLSTDRAQSESTQPEQVFDLNLNQVHGGRAILALVRRELGRKPATTETETIRPAFIYRGTFPDFELPSDGRLIELAHRWLKSPEPLIRSYGVWVLVQHKAPDVLAVVKSMLSDPGAIELSDHTSPWGQRVYPLRDAAVVALQDMGLPAPKVVLAEPTHAYRRVHLVWLLLAASIVCVLTWRTRRRLRINSIARLLCALMTLGTLVTVASWARSYWVADDFVKTRSGSMYELTCFQGGIRFEILNDFPLTTDLVYTSLHPQGAIGDVIGPTDAQFWHRFGTDGGGIAAKASTPCDRFEFQPHYSEYNYPEEDYVNGGPPSLGGTGWNASLLIVPYRYVVIATSSFPIAYLLVSLVGVLRRWRRRRAGRCIACAYDLSGTPGDRCPECGAVRNGSPLDTTAPASRISA